MFTLSPSQTRINSTTPPPNHHNAFTQSSKPLLYQPDIQLRVVVLHYLINRPDFVLCCRPHPRHSFRAASDSVDEVPKGSGTGPAGLVGLAPVIPLFRRGRLLGLRS